MISGNPVVIQGKVGAGTASPADQFHVSGPNAAIRVENTDTGFDSFAPLQFKTGASPDIWQIFARNGELVIGIANVADYMVIQRSGDVRLSGNVYAKGQLLGPGSPS